MYGRLFSLEEEVFQVLANEKRLEIIQLLRSGERNVSEMLTMLGLRQANLSQHLSLLKKTGLLVSVKKGREIYYRLSDTRIIESIDAVKSLLVDNYALKIPDDSAFPIVVDPVCGMRISISDAYGHVTRDATVHYFCASGCLGRFASR